jgi:hypothetical protein
LGVITEAITKEQKDLSLEPVAGGFVAWGVGFETVLKGMRNMTRKRDEGSAFFSFLNPKPDFDRRDLT